MKHLFVSLVLLSFTSLSQAYDNYFYCGNSSETFLALDIREDLFKVEHGNKPLIKNTNSVFDFETSELAETKFTIKAIDHENNNIYMFNKKTYVLSLSWSKVYYREARDNNWKVRSERVYTCTLDSRPND